jgi:hypothetical protein
VLHSRKEKIRGLWKRGHKYYAQLRMEVADGQTRPKMIPLQAATLDQARAELEKTRTHNREGKLPSPGHRPLFSAFADEYLKSPIHGQKKQSTRDGERVILEYWKKHLGGVRLDKITDVIVKSYREKRLAGEVTARTVNKETVAFYQVLKLANDRRLIASFPRVRQLKQKPPAKRPLLAPEEVERLLGHCTADVTKNAELLWYYLRFLVLLVSSGAAPAARKAPQHPDRCFGQRQEVLSPVSLAASKARANRKTDVRHVISLAFMPAVRDSGGNKGCLYFFGGVSGLCPSAEPKASQAPDQQFRI